MEGGRKERRPGACGMGKPGVAGRRDAVFWGRAGVGGWIRLKCAKCGRNWWGGCFLGDFC